MGMGRNGNRLHGNVREWECKKPFPGISSADSSVSSSSLCWSERPICCLCWCVMEADAAVAIDALSVLCRAAVATLTDAVNWCRWRWSEESAPVGGRQQRSIVESYRGWHLQLDGQHPQPIRTGGTMCAEETGQRTPWYHHHHHLHHLLHHPWTNIGVWCFFSYQFLFNCILQSAICPWSGGQGGEAPWSWNTFSFWTFTGSHKFVHFSKIWKHKKSQIFVLSLQKWSLISCNTAQTNVN